MFFCSAVVELYQLKHRVRIKDYLNYMSHHLIRFKSTVNLFIFSLVCH